jgi:hypothetical protein
MTPYRMLGFELCSYALYDIISIIAYITSSLEASLGN